MAKQDRMPIIYVAGPYRSETAWGVELNIRCAEEAALGMALLGAVPLCPHSMYRYFDGTITADYWLEATQELLSHCDAVLFVRGWEESEGSKEEHETAFNMPIPIFYEATLVQEIIKFVKEFRSNDVS